MHVLRETLRSLRASPAFALYVLITLGVAGYIGLMVGQMALGLDFFLPGLAAVLSGEFEIVVRRTPFRLIASVAVVAALLHPAGRHFFRSFRVSRVNWTMLALVGLAAVPLASFASTNVRLQATVHDEHFIQGHYAFMAAIGFAVIGVGLLASLRPDGWRLTAWVVGILPALIGGSSVLYPDASSSLDLGWALAAIAWGVVFVAVAELTKNAEDSTLLGAQSVAKVTAPAQPDRAAQHSTHAS